MIVASTLVAIALALIALYWYLTKDFNYWKDRNVPHKKPVPLFGNLVSLIFGNEQSGQFLKKLYNEFDGPYYGLYTMDKPFLVVKDPEMIKRILIKDFSIFPNRFFYANEKIDPVIANVLFGVKSSVWKFLRTKISPVYSTGKIKMVMPLIQECAKNMVNYLEQNTEKVVDTKDILAKYTTDVITSCSFGIDANSFRSDNSAFRTAGRKLFNESFLRTIQPLAYIFAHNVVKLFRFKFVQSEALSFLSGAFHKTIEERERTKAKRNDLIDILIELKNNETELDCFKFEGNRLLAQAVIFFAAGHETTSSTIAFTLYELALNPELQTRLREEINTVLEQHDKLTYEAVQDMKYLDMVVAETLRKYPISPFLQRQCEEDYLIEETGLVIERGVVVLISLNGLQWDPKYFPDPEKYDPERFSDENKSTVQPYTYMPFGDGPRNCIGKRFGLLNAKLGLIYVLQKFIVETNSKTRIPLVFGRAFLLQAVGGVPLTFKKIF